MPPDSPEYVKEETLKRELVSRGCAPLPEHRMGYELWRTANGEVFQVMDPEWSSEGGIYKKRYKDEELLPLVKRLMDGESVSGDSNGGIPVGNAHRSRTNG